MEKKESNLNETSWTWADQISSYRFWGLLIYFVLFMASTGYIFNMSSFRFLQDHQQFAASQIGSIYMIKSLAALDGFLLAWLAIRIKSDYILLWYSVLLLIGFLLFCVSLNIVLTCLALVIIGLISGAITLTVPSLIAGGRGGVETFLIAFGVVSFFETVGGVALQSASGLFLSNVSSVIFFIILAVPVILGMCFLIPIDSEYFTEIPPKRGYSFTPQKRDPVTAALLCLVPFYYLYWLYKAHGEIRSFSDSSKLLSPRAAVWSSILLPFLFPVIITTLNDCMNQIVSKRNSNTQRSSGLIILWSIFCYPVSVAMIQSDINQLNG